MIIRRLSLTSVGTSKSMNVNLVPASIFRPVVRRQTVPALESVLDGSSGAGLDCRQVPCLALADSDQLLRSPP